ncbi:substrate-binding domain-containing protein [Thalassotalea sediminis]|uniref:substrate-binding domain-containing protein n=1 Tax=Thalassotalea sediminis TaxID=1759089 RepID=UPI002573BB88|nr:substrate-binding domain-containing protein [Thalassotalea sediminis]
MASYRQKLLKPTRKLLLISTLISTMFSVFSYAVDVDSIKNAAKSDDVNLSKQDISTIKAKKLTAALVWHGSSAWVSAVTKGATKTFEDLGVKVVAVTDAQFDPAKQVADLENISALSPDIILSLSVDSISTSSSYRAAINSGAKLVLLSNPIDGFVHGRDYVGIVTDDMFGMGEAAAELVAESLDNKGNLGILYHDAKYFITNNRDQAFEDALSNYPDINVVTKRGFIKEHETSNITAAMVLQNPELQAIYVSWDTAAEGVIESLRSLDRRDIKVVTHDLGINNLLDMAIDGNLYGTVSDRPFDIGATMAKLGAASFIGQSAAPVTIVPFDKVTKKEISSIWHQAYKTPLPSLLNKALQQTNEDSE